MSEIVRLQIAPGMELSLSQARAEELMATLKHQVEGSAPEANASHGRIVLPDDHPLWEQHSGLDGHRDHPEWDAGADLAVAEAFYGQVGGKAKVFLDLLIDHPGQQLTVDDLCGLAKGEVFSGKHSVAGAINGLNHPRQASGRRYPFYWWTGSRYAMKPSVAGLFRQARINLGS
ncbi:DUF6416 domain-containing protein [Saccharopolyspora sp. CA-218241]|uniref:DUF6416 domain-containing protein n=1 Tax=Saccharopolyspora sp. CA-218241 TaxID=3240027 RepID=UPI003D9991FE